MLYKEIIAVCPEIHTQYINTAVWAEFCECSIWWYIQYSNYWTLMFNHQKPQKRDVFEYVLASGDRLSFAASIVMFPGRILDVFYNFTIHRVLKCGLAPCGLVNTSQYLGRVSLTIYHFSYRHIFKKISLSASTISFNWSRNMSHNLIRNCKGAFVTNRPPPLLPI